MVIWWLVMWWWLYDNDGCIAACYHFTQAGSRTICMRYSSCTIFHTNMATYIHNHTIYHTSMATWIFRDHICIVWASVSSSVLRYVWNYLSSLNCRQLNCRHCIVVMASSPLSSLFSLLSSLSLYHNPSELPPLGKQQHYQHGFWMWMWIYMWYVSGLRRYDLRLQGLKHRWDRVKT